MCVFAGIVTGLADILNSLTGILADVLGLFNSTTLGQTITLEVLPSSAAGSVIAASTSRDFRTKPVMTLFSRGCNTILLVVLTTQTCLLQTEVNPVFQPSVTSVSSDQTAFSLLMTLVPIITGTVRLYSVCSGTTNMSVSICLSLIKGNEV